MGLEDVVEISKVPKRTSSSKNKTKEMPLLWASEAPPQEPGKKNTTKKDKGKRKLTPEEVEALEKKKKKRDTSVPCLPMIVFQYIEREVMQKGDTVPHMSLEMGGTTELLNYLVCLLCFFFKSGALSCP